MRVPRPLGARHKRLVQLHRESLRSPGPSAVVYLWIANSRSGASGLLLPRPLSCWQHFPSLALPVSQRWTEAPLKLCSSGPFPNRRAPAGLLFIAVKALTPHCAAAGSRIQHRATVMHAAALLCSRGAISAHFSDSSERPFCFWWTSFVVFSLISPHIELSIYNQLSFLSPDEYSGLHALPSFWSELRHTAGFPVQTVACVISEHTPVPFHTPYFSLAFTRSLMVCHLPDAQ